MHIQDDFSMEEVRDEDVANFLDASLPSDEEVSAFLETGEDGALVAGWSDDAIFAFMPVIWSAVQIMKILGVGIAADATTNLSESFNSLADKARKRCPPTLLIFECYCIAMRRFADIRAEVDELMKRARKNPTLRALPYLLIHKDQRAFLESSERTHAPNLVVRSIWRGKGGRVARVKVGRRGGTSCLYTR